MILRPARMLGLLGLAWVAAAGCSTAQNNPAAPESPLGQPIKSSANSGKQDGKHEGPSVVFVRALPPKITLNHSYEASGPVNVLADIKDFDSRLLEVQLQFTGLPLLVPMERAKGSASTWRARLTQKQLELLAVNGQTVQYRANVLAKDDKGRVGQSQIPVEFAIQTPELAHYVPAQQAGLEAPDTDDPTLPTLQKPSQGEP